MTFNEWLETDGGKAANSALSYWRDAQPYLQNRLYWAFEAGVESGEHDRRLQATIDWYEIKIRALRTDNNALRKENKMLKEQRSCVMTEPKDNAD